MPKKRISSPAATAPIPPAASSSTPKAYMYGTAQNGGGGTACLNGCGVVFELVPIGNGRFDYGVIPDFMSGLDGALPQTTLTMDAAGNLYGTKTQGGKGGLTTSCFNGLRHRVRAQPY